MPILLLAAVLAGKLCIDGQPCTVEKLEGAIVAPLETARSFTWTDHDAKSVTLGIVAANSGVVKSDASGIVRVRLSKAIASDLTIRSKAPREWRVPLTVQQAKNGVDLRVDAGEYEIVAEAPHHRRAKLTKTVKDEPVVASFALEPFPQLTGRVIGAKDGQPILGATISAGNHVEAVAAGDGRFSFDADPDKWPASVTVAASGFGTLVVPLPRARASVDLLDIALHPGASVDVSVERPNDVPVTVAIYRRNRDSKDDDPLASRKIETHDGIAHFDALAPGQYVVIANGPGETERIGKQIELAAADQKAVTLIATPRRVTVTTKRGDEPLPDAFVIVSHHDGLWNSKLHTRSDGSIESPFWQIGRVMGLAWRETPPLTPYAEDGDLKGDEAIEWTITIPTREISGRVIDAATGKGIPKAFIGMNQDARGRPTIGMPATTDDDGRFHFDSAITGPHKILARADGYAERELFDNIRDEEQVHEITIALQAKPSARLTVRDAGGLPVVQAYVLSFAGLQFIGQHSTDDSGEVRIPLANGEIRDVYVVPRDGSIATATLRNREDMTVTVPAPQTTVVVSCVNTNNEPIPNMFVVMRINGVPLPVEVMLALADYQGATVFSGPDGRIVLRQMPMGVHEFWPLASFAEVRSALLGLGKKAPVTIVAHAGLNEATLTFKEKKP
jgi:hypothetical protein